MEDLSKEELLALLTKIREESSKKERENRRIEELISRYGQKEIPHTVTVRHEVVELYATTTDTYGIMINEGAYSKFKNQSLDNIGCYAVSFIGKPGAGKSTISAGLIQEILEESSDEVPVQNEGKKGLEPCSSNVTMWPVNFKFMNKPSKLLIFDYEGLGTNSLPIGFLEKVKNKIWDIPRLRGDVNSKFLPPLAYSTSDIIVYVSKSTFASEDYDKDINKFICLASQGSHYRPVLILISNTTDDKNATPNEQKVLKETEEKLYKSFSNLFCAVKCMTFPTYRGIDLFHNMHPTGLFAFHEAVVALKDAIEKGITTKRRTSHHPFSERLWLELFEKTVKQHTEHDKPSMYTILSEFLRPVNTSVKSAYYLFRRLLSINPTSSQHSQRVKTCVIQVLALRIIHRLRVDGITSKIDYGGQWKNENERLLFGNDAQLDVGPTDGADCNSSSSEESINLITVRSTESQIGLYKLISVYEPCTATFECDNDISCKLICSDHTAGWHKSSRAWYGEYSGWSIGWKAFVKLTSLVGYKLPTYWKGEHVSVLNPQSFREEFGEFYVGHALKDSNFLLLHESALQYALADFQNDASKCARLSLLENPSETQAGVLMMYCFLCICPLEEAFFPFECPHVFCKRCSTYKCRTCPVCCASKSKDRYM